MFNEKRFANTYSFPNHDIDKFILFLRIGLYSYEYMDNWEMSNEKLLAEREGFYGHLNMEDITDVDYTHRKRVWKD